MTCQNLKSVIAISCWLGIGMLSQLHSATANDLKEASPGQATSHQVLYVDSATGKDQPGGGTTSTTALRTVTTALRQAKPGTTIQLAPGFYLEETGEVFPLTIKPGITIRGDESNNGQRVVISGGGYYLSLLFRQQNVTVVAEGNSIIAGVTVTNSEKNGTGVWIESANPMVKNSTFAENYQTAVFVAGTSAPLIEANVFIENQRDGLLLTNLVQGQVKNNLFEKNNGFGLSIVGRSSPMVIENKISDNQDGILISNEANPLLEDNVISNNQKSGIVLVNFSEIQPSQEMTATFERNIFSNNRQFNVNWVQE